MNEEITEADILAGKYDGEEMRWDRDLQEFVPVSESAAMEALSRKYARIPLTWLVKASGMTSGALAVSVVLWHLSGTKRTATVRLGNKLLRALGVNRFMKYRALSAMSKAGMIRVDSLQGKNLLVTILHPEAGK